MLRTNLDRPLRYTPEGRDFVIVNGDERFNRPLYGGSSPFRVDAGDRPEFSFYLPGRGGNLRVGIHTPSGSKWLHDAARIEARYSEGTMRYELRDPFLGGGALRLTALSPKDGEGLLIAIETLPGTPDLDLRVAFGGIHGERGGRDGDIGCERVPVREFFRFRPEDCAENEIVARPGGFVVRAPAGTMVGLLPADSEVRRADARNWSDLGRLTEGPAAGDAPGVVAASFRLVPGDPEIIGLQHLPAREVAGQTAEELLEVYREASGEPLAAGPAAKAVRWHASTLADRFERERNCLAGIAGRLSVKTPDPFVDAAVAALNVAADGVWDDRVGAYLHGGVAWRTPLLGWRVAYAGDTLGWHDRTRSHFDRFAARQNTKPVPAAIPAPEEKAHRARNENGLHSNGDMTGSHYDMNLVGVDTIFRHLMWTGDLDYARKIWPVIERHLAWERRLFRREFGPDKLPLYEAYACIWASDSLAYNGGGGSHSSAYNLFHNRMAARIAGLLGHDPAPYEREAELIDRAMKRHLWLPDRGWFAEWKDLLGDQAVHPEAAAWTFYHTVDSQVPDPLEAWQMARFVETRLPHLPIQGPGVPPGNSTIATTSWMPWVWSLNNVVLGETAHTAHALWQAGKPESAFPLFKGCLLDSMFLGICPGNVGMCTWFDANRRESQRDFGDGVGALSRAVMEGLFGITPDLLAGEIAIRPGFPAAWDQASMHHPEFDFTFAREDRTDRFQFVSRFAKPVALRLVVPASGDSIAAVTANGRPLAWQLVRESVGRPRIEVVAPAATSHQIEIRWAGTPPASPPKEQEVARGASFSVDAGASVKDLADPQQAASGIRRSERGVDGIASGTPGHRTLFARVVQGELEWWQPVELEIVEAAPPPARVFTTDWSKPVDPALRLDPVPLDALYNEKVSRIFQQDYARPRPSGVSLSMPAHGFGSWCHPAGPAVIDDSGLRSNAAANQNRILLPNGVPIATPGDSSADNVAFVSRWENFPREIVVPLSGRATKIHLMMAGSTDAMKSRRDNGEIVVKYTDGSLTRLALENPTTWWPIDQDYFIDDHAFARPGPLPLRVDLKTGSIRVLDPATFPGTGRRVDGGAATVLDLSVDSGKELESMTVRAIANEVVIGLMGATLQRP